jgi:glucokinase
MIMSEDSWRLVFDAGGTNIRFGLVNNIGAIDHSSLRNTKTAKTISTREEFCDLIVNTIKRLGGRQQRYVISLAGPISSDNRVIRKYTNVLREDMDIPIADMVEDSVKSDMGREVEVFVIKDAVAASLAEMSPTGAAPDRDEVLSLILGTGTGGAPCIREDNGLFSYPESLADLGHHQVDIFNAEDCNCGGKGCVELQTSGTGIVRNTNKLAGIKKDFLSSLLYTERKLESGSITGEDIAWAALRGDAFIIEILLQAARPLAALLRNVFTSHPGMTVVFTGGFALGVGEPLLILVKDCLRVNGIPFIRRSNLDSFIEKRVLLGKIPSEMTNLVGARMYLMQKEKTN